jgi:DNA-binding transcriptional LysR family regulator
MPELATGDLRVLREVAERGSFTAAARALGYTQSAVSRRAAALEAAAGSRLFERGRDGVRLTPAGTRLLARAAVVLAELDAARRELAGLPMAGGPVRLGAFPSALAWLVPTALAAVASEHPDVEVRVREGTTPTLVRALRAGTIDLAILARTPPFRPLDAETPALRAETLVERELMLAVGAGHRFAGRDAVEVAELEGERWVASSSEGGESLLGAWPGLTGRPRIVCTVRDWMGKLALVAAGVGITTVPALLTPALPPGVRAVAVRGEPEERRRLALVAAPGREETGAVAVLANALRRAARSPG